MENEIKDFHPGDESINKSIDILLKTGVDFISESKQVSDQEDLLELLLRLDYQDRLNKAYEDQERGKFIYFTSDSSLCKNESYPNTVEQSFDFKDAILSHCNKYPNDAELGKEIRKWASKI